MIPFFFLFSLITAENILAGLDLGAENAHIVLLGGPHSFHVVRTASGKVSIPSLVVLNGKRRYVGDEAYQKVCIDHFLFIMLIPSL